MTIILSLVGCIGFLSLLVSAFTLSKLFDMSVEIQAFKKSTHSVQFVGASKEDINVSDESGLSEEIETYQKEYREQSQEAYPEFATFDEDLELKGL